MKPSASWPFAFGESPFRCKGTAYRSSLQVLADRAGGINALLGKVEPELAAFLRQPFLVSSWYDVAPLVELSRQAAPFFGMSHAELCAWSAREVCKLDLHSVYRFLLKLASTETIAARLPQVTATYLDFGETRIDSRGARRVVVMRLGTPHAIVDWYRHVGAEWTAEALRLSGAKGVECESSTLSAGSAHGVPLTTVRLEFRWT